MAEIENIHCPICTQPLPSSWQNALPPALATDEQRGEYRLCTLNCHFFPKLKVLCDMLDLTSEIYVEKETRMEPFFSELYTFSQECIRFPRLHKMQIRHLKNECTTAAEEDIRRTDVQ